MDVAISYHSAMHGYKVAAQQAGRKLIVKLWADYGMDIYNSGIVASDENLANKKDLTLRFLRGYYKSVAWGFRNREAATAIFTKSYPAAKPEIVLEAQNLAFLHLFDKNTHKNGVGYMDRAKMAKTIRVTYAASGIKTKLDPSELYTNEFVDRISEDLRFFYIR